jgi:hypothetical protein
MALDGRFIVVRVTEGMSTLARGDESTKTELHNSSWAKTQLGEYNRHVLIIHAYRSADVVAQVYRWYNENKRVLLRNSVFMEAKLP